MCNGLYVALPGWYWQAVARQPVKMGQRQNLSVCSLYQHGLEWPDELHLLMPCCVSVEYDPLISLLTRAYDDEMDGGTLHSESQVCCILGEQGLVAPSCRSKSWAHTTDHSPPRSEPTCAPHSHLPEAISVIYIYICHRPMQQLPRRRAGWYHVQRRYNKKNSNTNSDTVH